jgi:DNA-binding Lrp family transcriptional regulator
MTNMGGHNLDQVDRDLIALLEHDGRAPFSKLAEELDLSTDAVSARFKRLESGGIVRVIGMVSPSMVGYDTIAALAITSYGDTGELIERLSELPQVTFLASTRGEFNVLGELACADAEALLTVAYDVIPSLTDGVQRVEVWDFLRVDKWNTGLRNAPEPSPSTQPVQLDDEDIRVLQLLQQNARLRYTELADALDLSYSVARRRSQQLFDSGVVVAAVVVDRISVQHRVMATVGLNMTGDPRPALAAIAANPDVEILIRTSGRYQAIAEVRCPSLSDLAELIDEHLATAEGVVSATAHVYTRIAKLPAQWSFKG